MLYENFVRGRTKAIWFSASADLAEDARRDIGDLGMFRQKSANLLALKGTKPGEELKDRTVRPEAAQLPPSSPVSLDRFFTPKLVVPI